MVDVGVVQFGYNDLVVVLIIIDFFDCIVVFICEEIDDVLFGLFSCDVGWQ